jgi:DnaK suppressor protein
LTGFTVFIQDLKMDQADLDYFKNLLTQWLNELQGKAGSTMVGLIDPGEHLADPLDRAVFDTERGFALRIRDRESVLIKKILASLEDIEDGVYGICDECGRDIAIERLKARPVTRHCIRCKTRQEERERLTG